MNRRTIRKRLQLDGLVQGVGLRPFVVGLAERCHVYGWAANSPSGMILELEAEPDNIQRFVTELNDRKPPLAQIESVKLVDLNTEESSEFVIRDSLIDGPQSVFVAPDIATCAACLDECFDSDNRRFRYPFISCSQCGPRYSIISGLPYDRARTSMDKFKLCKVCLEEYESMLDRRYHAQTIACWDCGPKIEFWNATGSVIARQDAALDEAVEALRAGKIVALKGIGGFQLLVNAIDQPAVQRLRERKRRSDKPFAVMCADIKMVSQIGGVSDEERAILLSPAAPIVLLREKYSDSALAESVAPGHLGLGVMLAYSPVHHIIVQELQSPVVATSANLSGEPICIDEDTALEKLNSIADFFLVHNRNIQRPLDDSVVSISAGKLSVVRRARGYVPTPIKVDQKMPEILAVGGHLKSTVAVAKDNYVVLSQYLGDLKSEAALKGFTGAIDDLQSLYQIKPGIIARDWHPDFASSQYLMPDGAVPVGVQHHYAHVLACMAEHGLEAPVLGVAWDGFGLGLDLDQCLWGGEFLRIDKRGFKRLTAMRNLVLCGGDKAATEPRRSGLAFAFEIFGENAFSMTKLASLRAFKPEDLSILRHAMEQHINAITTSSVGRLFDAVASLLDLCQICSFEAQAAIYLEHLAFTSNDDGIYSFSLIESGDSEMSFLDWEPMLRSILQDCNQGVKYADIARKFHNTLAEMVVETAHRVGHSKVVLSGGSFQNRLLLERCVHRLREEGLTPYWSQRIPVNDSGLALGQIFGAVRDGAACV